MHNRESEPKFWWHKAKGELRWWFHFGDSSFHISLTKPDFHFSFGVDGSGERTLHGSFSGFYWNFENHKLARWIEETFNKDPERWHPIDRSFRFYWHNGGLWLALWGDDTESRASDPWWKKMHHLNFVDLILGKAKYASLDVESFENVVIPLPEKNYLAKVTYETCMWKRPRWFAKVRDYSRIEFDKDKNVPPSFPGKGENSWDCGDDHIWQTSCSGHSIPKAIGHYVTSVMEYRMKRQGK